ncbi:MAG: hypothetical protein KJZ75_00795 [Hyphomonadaceae bacterium]|nr:hypothetical protein [Hyphomonadaceae bacterium]GIK49335.1 MAG: hypothetical protein BroJett013_20320 [Alphaproteobacteria bacterium]
MNARTEPGKDIYRKATADDVRHIVGDVEDVTLAAILSYAPNLRDLSDAAIWVRGDGDLIAREHRELGANALAIAELLSRVEEEEESQQQD